MVNWCPVPMDGPRTDILSLKAAITAESGPVMPSVVRSWRPPTEPSCIPACKFLASMVRLLPPSGSIKSESPKVSNVVTTCGCQDTSWEELVNCTDVTPIMTPSLFWATGMDPDATPTSLLRRLERREDTNSSLMTACPRWPRCTRSILPFMVREITID